MHRSDPAVLPVRPCVRRDEQRPGERNQLDHDRADQDGAEHLPPAPEQHERGQIRGEGEGEEREEEGAERTTVREAAVGRHERRSLDPRARDAARDEGRDRPCREQRGSAQGSTGSVGGGSVSGGGGGAVVGGGAAVVGAGVGFGAGRDAGGASGTDSPVCVAVVAAESVVAGGV